MKILAIEHELSGTTAEQFQKYAKDEARMVWELHQAGIIRELYFRSDRNEAVLVFESDSVTNVEEALTKFPFVQAGLIIFELIPLKAYPGFERLFTQS